MAERPEHIPEKFWDPENETVRVDDLAKSYAELERKASQSKPPAGSDPKADPEPTKSSEDLKLEDFDAELNQFGQLSPNSRQRLVDSGIPEAMVDAYVANRQSSKEAAMNDAYEAAGGKEKFEGMRAWVGQELGQDAVKALDNAVNSGDPYTRESVIRGMYARYAEANSEPTLVEGRGAGGKTGASFGSWEEVQEAMKDPKYRRDPAYRAEVERKIARSSALGNATPV